MPGPGYLEMLQISTLAKPLRAQRKMNRRYFLCKKTLHLCALRASAREKTINSRQGAKHAKVFRIKNKIKIEVPGDLSAFARKKYIKSRLDAKPGQVFGLRTE